MDVRMSDVTHLCHHHHLFFKSVHFFHAQLGLDVLPDMKPLHISPYPHISVSSPPPSPHFYRPTPNHLHSYVPHAKTTSVTLCTPRRLCKSTLRFLSFSDTPHIHLTIIRSIRPLQTMQICFFHRPGFSPICRCTLDTSILGYIDLFLYAV